MSDDDNYFTPHEAALAVVATSMKKARLRLDTLIINSIVGGVLFSAGGMLHLCAQATNPEIYKTNPGIIHFMQGSVYPIALFYVVIMGADLYNSNILYFSVGVCRGAVSILDLLISWSISWLFNLGANLFVCYVICNLSGTTKTELYINGSIQIAMEKERCTFIQSFIKGIAANFAVSLAVYLQLLAKPIHVKFLMMFLPVFTFVTMGYNHAVADMFLIPMGMFNGAPISVGKCIWKLLIPAALGNAIGGSAFGIIIPWYLHLVVVERDRRLLNLPEYEAKDEQPELEMDSRVRRVPSAKEKEIDEELDSSEDLDDNNYNEHYDPVSYRPDDDDDYIPQENIPISRTNSRISRLNSTSTPISRSRSNSKRIIQQPIGQRSFASLSRIPTNSSRLSHKLSKRQSLRSPPGVFPVMGMGEPLSRERSIASNHQNKNDDDNDDDVGDDQLRNSDDHINSPEELSLDSDRDSRFDNFSIKSTPKLSKKEREKRARERQKLEEDEYAREGGYNARENNMGENLKRVFTRRKSTPKDIENAINGERPSRTNRSQQSNNNNTNNNNTNDNNLFKTISRTLTQRQPGTQDHINKNLSQHSITPRAANASDNIAGIDSYDMRDTMRRPSLVHRRSTSRPPEVRDVRGALSRMSYPSYYSSHDNDNFEQQSVASNPNHIT